jgi:hypothetical protein
MPAASQRTFTLHWGSGVIAEEARFAGEHHVPALQLLAFTEGEAAGTLAIRFATYDHRGRFQRFPLIVGEGEVAGLRRALQQAPQLRALLRQLVAD